MTALVCWCFTMLIAVGYPLDIPVDESMPLGFVASYLWVGFESATPLLVSCGVAFLVARWLPRIALWVGTISLFALPALVLLDCIAFHWSGERLLSPLIFAVVFRLMPNLIQYATVGSWFYLGLTIFASVMIVVGTVWGRKRLSLCWATDRKGDLSPTAVWGISVALTIMTPLFMVKHWRAIGDSMSQHSTRHPFCALRWVGHRGIGLRPPVEAEQIESQLRAMTLADPALDWIERWESASFEPSKDTTPESSGDSRPDVLLVVVESLQSDLLNPETMPHSDRLASESMRLNNHFSGGNCTSLGFFSVVTGREATWFPMAARMPIAMNRIFKANGYEIGFFAGVDSYSNFEMDTYINRELFDVYYGPPSRWIETDRIAAEKTRQFLDQNGEVDQPRPPRLAVLYFFSTHSPFDVLPGQERFEPMADRGFTIPFTMAGRPPIYNRYRNAVRSIDHLLEPLLNRDRVIAIVGDHGESLMEDRSIGHGTRLNTIQCQTPGLIHVPGQPATVIGQPTSHIDVLPSILAGCGISVDSSQWFDGVDLYDVSDKVLDQRVFATCNFIRPELLLIGPWTSNEAKPFGYRCGFSLASWKLYPLNPVDKLGLEWTSKSDSSATLQQTTADLFSEFLLNRFGIDPTVDQRDVGTLLPMFLDHRDIEIRLRALQHAGQLEASSESLVEKVGGMMMDPNEEIRKAAKRAWINLQRRSGKS